MLLDFELWLMNNTNYNVILNENELSNSLVIDIDDEDNIARFTAWDDNSCMLEIINLDTGEHIINERHEVSKIEDFIRLIMNFIKVS